MIKSQTSLANPKKKILSALQKGTLTVIGQFMQSSNYTFLSQVKYKNLEFQAVYKPQKGETPLWDFPVGSLCKREVAAYFLSEKLGWDLVPPTVFRRKAPLGLGALQLFVDHDPNQHYFSFDEKNRQCLKSTVLFDLILNNADRKGGHILVDENNHLWLIDHGTTFHSEFKLRSVVWDFSGQEIPESLLSDVERLGQDLATNVNLLEELLLWLTEIELHALQKRINIILHLKTFPFPDKNRRTVPWPPL
jgi:uncharacterized repeat protein (TIGR03843 family)